MQAVVIAPRAQRGTETTFTVAVSIFEVSATLVATTWYVPSVDGAVYRPAESTIPPPASCTDQVTATDCLAVVPVTVAENVTTPSGCTELTFGKIETAIGEPELDVTVPLQPALSNNHARNWA
jgi:hypothetical protein